MRQLAVAGALVLVGVIAEATQPRPPRPEATERDRGTLPLFALAIYGGFGVAFASSFVVDGSTAWAMFGVPVGLGGIAFRYWSIVTLGRWFTRTVQVSGDQPVIEEGPYRWLRHPSYTGLALWCAGVGVSLGQPLGALLATAPVLAIIAWRTEVEERALVESLGDRYAAYMTRTKRFIPWVY